MVWNASPGNGSGGGGYTPPDPATLPKLVISSRIWPGDFAGLGLTAGATGSIPLPDWSPPAEETGSAIDYSVASSLILTEPGIYATGMVLNPRNVYTADPAMDLRFQAIPYTYNGNCDCSARGGDGLDPGVFGDVSALPSTSFTYYVQTDPGDDRGRIDFQFLFGNFDDFNLGILDFTVSVQQVVAG